ncbi:MAG: GNAT family N-acetyltransferase [Alistipes sp.]|nr:GNAT family N-acetyltransferase [Alistipes sp.]
MVFIEGDRVVLRSVDCSDIDTLLLWENSTDEPLYGVYEEQYTRENVAQFVENQQRYSIAETEQLRLMICSHEGERLGCIDLTEYDGKKAFVSILIKDLCNRRKGFAENALRLTIDYAKSLGLHALYARIMPENTPSISLFTKVGFEELDDNLFAYFL